jgi:hypothetical protein
LFGATCRFLLVAKKSCEQQCDSVTWITKRKEAFLFHSVKKKEIIVPSERPSEELVRWAMGRLEILLG